MLSKYSAIKPILKYPSTVSEETLKNSQCLLTISVGQEVHESAKFAATIDLVNTHFACCTLLIDDSLQRHTMALQKTQSADFFYEKSLREGDLWLDRNEKHYSELKIPYKIIRWDTWLKHPNYSSKNQIIHESINTDSFYKQAFEKTIKEFLRRYYNRFEQNKLLNLEKDHLLCFNYLVEECTALCLWPELNCQFEVYPSQRNFAMEATHRRFIMPIYPNLLNELSIKFKNRQQFKAQCFRVLKEQAR